MNRPLNVQLDELREEGRASLTKDGRGERVNEQPRKKREGELNVEMLSGRRAVMM